jgi:hypothetical protein
MNPRFLGKLLSSSMGLGLVLFYSMGSVASEPAASAPDRVTSQVLFERGRALFIERNYAEACPLLEESHRLAPGIGVLLHLGACLEKSGKTASAWAAFQEAADRARAEGDAEREGVARTRANELRSKLAYLTLRVRNAAGELLTATGKLPTGLDLRRDGQTLSISALGLELPVDPGEHSVVVRAAELLDVKKSVTLAVGEHASLELMLAPNPNTAPKAPPATLPLRVTTVKLVPAPRRQEPANAWPYVAWTAAGIGGVGLLTGGVAGFLAYTKMREARAMCEGLPNNECPTASTQRQEEARLPAHISTAAVAVGATGLAFAGGYWLLSRQSRTVMTGSIQPGIALISMQSRW